MILVVGAGGIVGQHLRLTQPERETVVYTARERSFPYDYSLKLETDDHVETLLDHWVPDVVVNLAGENRPDVVERDPGAYSWINTTAPMLMAQWCAIRRKRMIHVSTQGVFGGTAAPYKAELPPPDDLPINQYGYQKLRAEIDVLDAGGEIARLTFVLGVRPFPHVGRANPLEQMFATISGQMQVEDRYFSPCYAMDAAEQIWQMVRLAPHARRIWNIGTPISVTRAWIAAEVIAVTGEDPEKLQRVKHADAFPTPKWAPRPHDTTFASDACYRRNFATGLVESMASWRALLDYMDPQDRAVELAYYFNIPQATALSRLGQGFGVAHNEVNKDFRSSDPKTDPELLEWYRRTTAYIWELTAYHLDAGFNYMGMCDGIVNHLQVANRRRVLCLGDGVGDLSMRCADGGLSPVYHDLDGSKTAAFALFRMERRYGHALDTALTPGWEPPEISPAVARVDAIVALDFFEHLTDVEGWVRRCFDILSPGGLFVAQNAFGIGNEPGGSLPMHLTRNDRFERDWDPLLESVGFVRHGGGNWRIKP